MRWVHAWASSTHRTTGTLVDQLNIALPRDSGALAALSAMLDTVAHLPEAEVTIDGQPRMRVARPRPVPDPGPAELFIEPDSRTVLRHGKAVALTRLEFDLLLFLARRPRRVLPRQTLMAEVWGIDHEFSSRTVDVHVRRLRDKLGPEFTLIATVRGVGYRFDGPHDVVHSDSFGGRSGRQVTVMRACEVPVMATLGFALERA